MRSVFQGAAKFFHCCIVLIGGCFVLSAAVLAVLGLGEAINGGSRDSLFYLFGVSFALLVFSIVVFLIGAEAVVFEKQFLD